MYLKLFMALLTGGLAYIVVVFKGLILRLPLPTVFNRGLVAFIILTFVGWLITYLLETFGDKDGNHNQLDNGEETAENQQSSENEFSPLNPTVLEVEESNIEAEEDLENN